MNALYYLSPLLAYSNHFNEVHASYDDTNK